MPPRRGAPSINTLSPPDNGLAPQGARSPGSQNFPRSASPSTGISNFFSKPSKWFTRSNSSGAIPGRSSTSSTEPRSSSSSSRKPKISHPTDPRPILDQLRPEPAFGVPVASRSVLDLSTFGASHSPSSPGRLPASSGLGDLRNLARKPWSKSVDDLGKFSQSNTQPLARIDTSIQDRIDTYRTNRNDSVGSTMTPSSTHSPQGSLNLPFPTITTNTVETPSSSPPGRTGILTAGSSPVSTGTPPLTPNSQTSPHVHARSHSFTPRLPSKLASPKLGLVPPSPKRKGSASETESIKEKSTPTHTGSLGSGPSSRPGFPFNFGSSSSIRSVSPLNTDLPSPLDKPGASPALLAPPTIVEPGGDSPKGEKRSSQLVYHSGFINRLPDFSPAAMNSRATYSYMSGGGTSLSKGWKPFKLVLKGSKLYFYKPPSDRSAAIKDLFPTELVVVLEDEGVLDEETGEKEEVSNLSNSKGKEREKGRKRAYWGSSTHPALVFTERGPERGPLEALIHEAVFNTRYKSTGVDEDTLTWEEFSSSVLCTLPAVVDRSQFEVEFRRCCSMLVDTAADDQQDTARQKVTWLARQYLSFHGAPADTSFWDEWISKTVPGFSADTPKLAGLPQSASTEGLYAPSPEQPSTAQLGSPDLGAFSPRPSVSSGDRMLSLLDALGDPPAPLKMPSQSKPWHNALEQSGFSREILVGLDPQLIARSLYVYNLRALQQAPPDITVTALSSAEDPSEAESSNLASLSPFLGSEERPHWLTRLVLFQILMSESATMQVSQSVVSSRSADDRGGPPRMPFRADVIAAWARIGELARRTGDECSWRAIFAALCSRPIARLDKVWKKVETDALRLVQSWVFSPEGNLKADGPRTIPWAGEHLRAIKEIMDAAHVRDSEEWLVKKLSEAYHEFNSLREDFAGCMRTTSRKEDVAEDVEVLAKFWQSNALHGQNAGFAAKFKRIEQFMSLSLAIEPRRRGMFEPYYWTRPAVPQTFHPLTPLLFPEPLPSTTFVDRPLIHRSRFESTASTTFSLHDLQQLRDTLAAAQAKNNTDDKASAIAGTMINVYDGELILLVSASDPASSQPSSRAPSRPPSSVVDTPPSNEKTFSRNPSVRVKPGTKTLERKPSQLRRSSLPALSRKLSFEPPDTYSERPLRVLIQAGTLDRLVSVLVEGLHGVSVSVADDNGEMPLNDRKPRELKVDMADFLRVWWNTYRSIVTPHVFFELLRKKYDAAQIKSHSPAVEDIVASTRSRTDVLESIRRWIQEGGGAQDALDDPQLYAALVSFFNHPTEHGPPPGVSVPESLLPKTYNLLQDNVHAVRSTFHLYTMRPTLRYHAPNGDLAHDHPQSQTSPALAFGADPPNIDEIDPADLVANLDAMAAAAFRNLSQEDLFVTADILEVQTADRLGWFLSRDPSAISDEVEIQSIHGYLQDIEPSPMIHELSQDSVYRLLPPPVRGCIRAFMSLRKWLIFKLTARTLGLRARQARMETVLKAIEIARYRSADPATTNPFDTPCDRSFVEAVLTSAVVSVESRMYHRAWQSIAATRGTTCDTLAAILSKTTMTPPVTKEPLTLDVGWLLERVLEVICTADVLEENGTSLVNFDKRRSLHALLTYKGIGSIRRVRNRTGRDLERLNNMEQEVSDVQFDLRIIREDAYREAGGTTPSTLRKQPRPFQTLVAMQQEKNKRDKAIRDRLSREKRQEQHKQDKREEYLNKAMHTRRPGNPAQKVHRNKKSVSSAFFQLMRPISSAFTSETPSTYAKRTPAELDFAPSHKPAMVLDVVNARVATFVNTERSFLFQVDTEDGGHYLLQAMDKADMKKWMETIERVSKTAAQRRLTYLGQNSKMQLSDHLLSGNATCRDPKAVFGIGLEELLQRESPDGEIQPGAIPSVISKLFSEVESRGLTEVGIYRLAGAHTEVGLLRDALNRGEWPIDRYTDINAVCDLIKSWFRVLPGGMFPPPTHMKIMDAAAINDADLETKLAKIREVVHELPRPHFDLLKRLMEHLDKVTDFEESNQMTAESLSTVFSPNLLRSAEDDVGFFFAHMGHAHRATKMLISHAHTIFDDVEPDLDVDQDGESEDEYEHFDAPIPEEDEEEDELMSAGHESSDEGEDGGQTAIAPAPPVLDLTLPSPSDLFIPMPP